MAKKELTTKGVVMKKNSLIIAPRMTEKASLQGDHNAYTFEVVAGATKHTLVKEIKDTYKVTPVKINITKIPAQNIFVRGKWGMTAPLKKAIVFLKKGDTIKLA